jgi:chromosomal replication initiation ATPase DnaA
MYPTSDTQEHLMKKHIQQVRILKTLERIIEMFTRPYHIAYQIILINKRSHNITRPYHIAYQIILINKRSHNICLLKMVTQNLTSIKKIFQNIC